MERNPHLLIRLIRAFPKGTIWQTRYVCLPAALVASSLIISHSELPIHSRVFWFALGLFSWTLLEYVLHRWLLHWRPRSSVANAVLERLHIEHHRNPADETQVCMPPFLLFPLWGWLFLNFVLLGANAQGSLLVVCGIALMMVIYDITHFSTHYMEPTNWILRRLKKQHMLHHFSDETRRFGVTSPLWDHVFGTYR